jgi:N-acetylglucosamine-6-phosphate deacetylase
MYDATSNDSTQWVMKHMGAARNIKRMIVVAPERYDTPQYRAALADQVFMAKMHHRKAMQERKAHA